MGYIGKISPTTSMAVSTAVVGGSYGVVKYKTNVSASDIILDGSVVSSSSSNYSKISKFIAPMGVMDSNTKLTNPATLPTSTGRGTAFSQNGVYMSVAHSASPFIAIYKRDGDTFTKLTNPDILPTNTGYSTAFSPNGVYMSVAHSSSPYITIYKRDGDTFTKLADPDILPTSTGLGTAFSPDGVYMSVAHGTLPYITIYKSSSMQLTLPNIPTQVSPNNETLIPTLRID